MKRHGNRARLSGVLLAAAAALAMLVLPGLASSHGRHHDLGDAGTIQSFDPQTGVLAIDLADGGSVSGLVVRRTHIRCGDDHGHHHGLGRHLRGQATASHRGEDENEDEHGNSGPGNRRGENDDPPGHDGTPPGSSEDPGRGAEHSDRCTTDDLVAGATVRVAELVLIDGKAIYRLVALPGDEQDQEPNEDV